MVRVSVCASLLRFSYRLEKIRVVFPSATVPFRLSLALSAPDDAHVLHAHKTCVVVTSRAARTAGARETHALAQGEKQQRFAQSGSRARTADLAHAHFHTNRHTRSGTRTLYHAPVW